MYEDVYEKKNAAFLACDINRYPVQEEGRFTMMPIRNTWLRLRKIMEDAKVHFQTAELGRVDVGGGGTIAYLMSVYGMEVIDSGVAVLGMHAPWETTSKKADVYEAVRCYEAFFKGRILDSIRLENKNDLIKKWRNGVRNTGLHCCTFL